MSLLYPLFLWILPFGDLMWGVWCLWTAALSLSLSHPGLLCGMVPIVPPTMYGCTFASCDAFARGRLLHKDHVEHFWNLTVPPHLAQHHSVSPLRCASHIIMLKQGIGGIHAQS
jgi:hypothetical protein